jgi:HlyD family secretion protein
MLRPNLRVEVFVITSTLDDVIRVRNGPFFNASADQKVFIVKNNKALRVDAEFGASNFDYVQIVSGVNAGDEVIISNMEDYYHMKEIEIK